MNGRLLSSLVALLTLTAAGSMAGCSAETPAQSEQNVDETASGSFEVFVGEDEQFYFRLVTSDGDMLLRSEGYTEKHNAEKGIASAKRNGVARESFEVLEAEDALWYFTLIAQNGEIVAVSSPRYETAEDAEAGVAQVQKIVTSITTEEPKIICFLKRTAEVPQGEGEITADLTNLGEEEWAFSNGSLEAFDGAYSFDASLVEGTVDVYFYENKHVQDETGGHNCEAPATFERGASFCNEPIVIDASLGTDEEERMVHAFDFGCRID